MADLAGTEIKPHKKMTTFLIVFSIIVLWVLPMFTGTILSAAYEFVANDIIYGDYDSAIGLCISIANVVSEFAGFAVIIFVFSSELRNKKRVFLVFQFVSYIITLLCTLFINYLTGISFFELFWFYLLFATVTFAVSAAVYLVLVIILKKEKCHADIPELKGRLISLKVPCLSSAFIISAIWLAVKTVSAAIDTVYLLVDYGFPTTVNDIIYLVTPYIENILLAVTGYFITVGFLYVFSIKYKKLRTLSSPEKQ